MYVLLLSPEGGFFLQPDYGNVRPVGIPHSDSTHFGQYPLDAGRGGWGTCSIEEGVTVYMEWYQISDCPEVCGACNWIRTSSHKTRKEICLPRTRSAGQSLPWPSDPSKQRRAVLDMNVKLVLDYRPREVLLNVHVSSNLLKLLPYFIQIQSLKNLDLSWGKLVVTEEFIFLHSSVLFIYFVGGIKPGISYMLDKCSTLDPIPPAKMYLTKNKRKAQFLLAFRNIHVCIAWTMLPCKQNADFHLWSLSLKVNWRSLCLMSLNLFFTPETGVLWVISQQGLLLLSKHLSPPLENLGSRTAHGLIAPECLIPGMRQHPVCSKSEVAEVVIQEADFVEKVSTPEKYSNLSLLPFKLIDENKQQVSC